MGSWVRISVFVNFTRCLFGVLEYVLTQSSDISFQSTKPHHFPITVAENSKKHPSVSTRQMKNLVSGYYAIAVPYLNSYLTTYGLNTQICMNQSIMNLLV